MHCVYRFIGKLKPSHGLLLMAERKVLMDKLPPNADSSIAQLIGAYNPTKNMITLSVDAKLTLDEVRNGCKKKKNTDVSVHVYLVGEKIDGIARDPFRPFSVMSVLGQYHNFGHQRKRSKSHFLKLIAYN